MGVGVGVGVRVAVAVIVEVAVAVAGGAVGVTDGVGVGDVGFGGTVSLFKTYAGRASDLQPWLAQAEINRDRNLRLQYLAGMGLNVNQGKLILDEIVSYRRFPDDLFVGSGMRNTALRWALQPQDSVH